jgi:hypothetical protein
LKLFIEAGSVAEVEEITEKGIERFAADWESRREFGEWLTDLVGSDRAAAT